MKRAARIALAFAATLMAATLLFAFVAHHARADEPEAHSYVIVPADLLNRAATMIETQRAEIARLRATCKLEPI